MSIVLSTFKAFILSLFCHYSIQISFIGFNFELNPSLAPVEQVVDYSARLAIGLWNLTLFLVLFRNWFVDCLKEEFGYEE